MKKIILVLFTLGCLTESTYAKDVIKIRKDEGSDCSNICGGSGTGTMTGGTCICNYNITVAPSAGGKVVKKTSSTEILNGAVKNKTKHPKTHSNISNN